MQALMERVKTGCKGQFIGARGFEVPARAALAAASGFREAHEVRGIPPGSSG
jgi:hypothetical protein